MTPSVPELDSIETVRSQVVLQEFQELKSSETVLNEIMELISEPAGSKLLSENKRVSNPSRNEFGTSKTEDIGH